ncbi:MAG: hypothetical protein IJS90_07105 [Clostridia bacterium]|nr:hypothetical protein [Clostridia bacterium]
MENRSGVSYYSGKNGISSSTLKIIAVATMFIDHVAAVFEKELNEAIPHFSLFDGLPFMRIVGRIAFPLFAFMIAEGAGRTKNIYKYMLRLLVFVFISEIPFDLALYHTPLSGVLRETEHQNVFITLFLGLASIWVYQLLQKKRLELLAFPALLVFAFLAEELFKSDYGAMGVICIFLFYVFLHSPGMVKNIGVVFTVLILPVILSLSVFTLTSRVHFDVSLLYNDYEFFAVLALPFILLYNGEKGKNINKYLFYGFYPGHMLLLWGLYMLICG